MTRVLIISAIIGFVVFRWYWKRAETAEERKRLTRNALLWGLCATIIILAATGRIHWLGAVFAAMFPVLKFLFGALLRFFPLLAQIYGRKGAQAQTGDSQAPPATAKMNSEEAREILGVSANCNAEEVKRAHKKLIQKLHPDRGGNDYLASRINEARDLLLNEIDKG